MATRYNDLIQQIDDNVNTNGQKLITGAILNNVLKGIVDTLGSGYRFGGVITPSSETPDPVDEGVFYLASSAGTYFSDVTVTDGELAFIHWDSENEEWAKTHVSQDEIGIVEVENGQTSLTAEEAALLDRAASFIVYQKYVYQKAFDNRRASGSGLVTYSTTPIVRTSSGVVTLETKSITESVFANGYGVPDRWLLTFTESTDTIYTKAQADTLLASKQAVLSFDAAPASGSANPVTSGGVYDAIADFVTRSVSDLANYYLKADVYTKGEVNTLIEDLHSARFEIVSQLPVTGLQNVIYLVPTSPQTTTNNYDEYVYINNRWERIGNTSVDLSNYYTKAQTDGRFVHLTGNETIGGVKTFSDGILFLNDTTITVNSGGIDVYNEGIITVNSGSIDMNANKVQNLGTPTDDYDAANKKYVDDGLATKQDTLTFDAEPTAGSTNPVKSQGVKTALDNKANTDGTYENLTAGDIVPKSNEPQEHTSKYAIQTTGGDADLENGTAYLYNIKGNLDDSLNPFMADTYVSTGMNLVDPNAYYEHGTQGEKMYYFPVCAGVWGEYGTTQDNNGYVIFGDDIVPNQSVYFVTEKPTGASGVASIGELCPYEVHEGTTFYLPSSDGWLCIFSSDVPACHIAWSNYNDDVEGEFDNFTLDLSDVLTNTNFPNGMAGIVGSNASVFDEIDLENGKAYRRIGMVDLASLTWTMTSETTTDDNEQTTTYYTFSATIDGMGGNYLCKHLCTGFLSNNGNVLTSLPTNTITSVADFVDYLESLANSNIYYELATVVETDITIDSEITANDFGLTYFLNDGEIATTEAYVTEAFAQSGKDQLFNAVTYQKTLAEVVATALCEIDARLDALESVRNTIECANLIVNRSATIANGMTAVDVPSSSTASGNVGDFAIASGYLYVCVATDTWKRVALSSF